MLQPTHLKQIERISGLHSLPAAVLQPVLGDSLQAKTQNHQTVLDYNLVLIMVRQSQLIQQVPKPNHAKLKK